MKFMSSHPSNSGDYFFRGVAKLRGLAKAKDLHQLPLAAKQLDCIKQKTEICQQMHVIFLPIE